MSKKILITALFLGILSIIFGAFGAHALKKLLTDTQLTSFETGVRYQMYHAFFLLFVGETKKLHDVSKKRIFIITLLGILFFSGSIYLLTLGDHFGIDIKSFGFITPVGGLLLITAWICVIIDFLSLK